MYKIYNSDYTKYTCDDGSYKIKWSDGTISFSDKNNNYHRLDGPAITSFGKNYWWYHGRFINCKTQEEFERLIRLKAFW